MKVIIMKVIIMKDIITKDMLMKDMLTKDIITEPKPPLTAATKSSFLPPKPKPQALR